MYPIHKLGGIFPDLLPGDYEHLRESIKNCGQLEPITLLDGQILDGRHRARACEELGLKADVVEFTADKMSAVEFVLGRNFHRRHLTPSQRAMVLADLVKVQRGRPSGKDGNSQHFRIEQAAKLGRLSIDTMRDALVVRDAGSEQLKRDVRAGVIAVSAAAEQVKPPPPRKNFIEVFAKRLDAAMVWHRGKPDEEALRAPGVDKLLQFISLRIAEYLAEKEYGRWEGSFSDPLDRMPGEDEDALLVQDWVKAHVPEDESQSPESEPESPAEPESDGF